MQYLIQLTNGKFLHNVFKSKFAKWARPCFSINLIILKNGDKILIYKMTALFSKNSLGSWYFEFKLKFITLNGS